MSNKSELKHESQRYSWALITGGSGGVGLAFSEGLAAELQPQGINISVASPGFTKSNLAPHKILTRYPLNQWKRALLRNIHWVNSVNNAL